MPAVNITDLRDRVYRRLGDREWFTSSGANPTAASTDAVDEELNASILEHVRIAERFGYKPLNDSATIPIVSGTREYDLEDGTDGLVDASGVPNFRGDLVVFRTDTDKPIPVRWAEGGDWRVRESYRGAPRFFSYPDEQVNEYPGVNNDLYNIGGSRGNLVLYRRGKWLGFVKEPTETMTLTCYYTPSITTLTDDAATDTLEEIGLPYLQDWADLLALYAAIQLHTDMNSPTGIRLERRYARLLEEYTLAAQRMRHVVTMPSRHRWVS